MRTVDLNADIGESFAGYKLGKDEDIIRYITSANIAAGFHAGDPDWVATTVELAESHGVAVGAHPSYPDLQGFGRRDMGLSTKEIRNAVVYQVGAVAGFAKDHRLQHVKPHGALYNRAAKDREVAETIVSALLEFDEDMVQFVLHGSVWQKVAERMDAIIARECFADRAIMSDGSLAPRSMLGAVIHDPVEVVDRSLSIVVDGKVQATDGSIVEFQADTLCLHGDTPDAVGLARRVRKALEDEGVIVASRG